MYQFEGISENASMPTCAKQSKHKLTIIKFCHFCRSANLILNLFSLMLDAGVPDIALEPDKTVQKVYPCN